MGDIDHVFVGENWHIFNEIYPFYQCLKKENKLFFTDVCPVDFPGRRTLTELSYFSPNRKKAVLYFSTLHHFETYHLRKLYHQYKIVRLPHGLIGPWAKILQRDIFWDATVAFSPLDAKIWEEYHPQSRVEIIGWPKGENFYRGHFNFSIEAQKICIGSNWSREKSAFEICDRLGDLKDYEVTFMLHPNLFKVEGHPRSVDQEFLKKQLLKLDHQQVKIVSCEEGALKQMRGNALMLGTLSSTSLEWLLFNQPIIYLKSHPYLDFGQTLNESHLRSQIEQALNAEDDGYRERREELREELMSSFDGNYAKRFNDLAGSLEEQLKQTPILNNNYRHLNCGSRSTGISHSNLEL